MLAPVVLAMLITAVLVLAVLGFLAKGQQRKELIAFAHGNNLSYARRDPSLLTFFSGPPFDVQGHRRSAEDIVRGTWRGRQVCRFTFRWSTGGGENESTQERTVCLVKLPGWVSQVHVEPANALTRLGSHLGLEGIQLESEDFNRRWIVTASERKLAVDVLSPRTMQLLMGAPRDFELHLEGVHVIGVGECDRTSDITARWTMLGAFVDAIPSFVWTDAKG